MGMNVGSNGPAGPRAEAWQRATALSRSDFRILCVEDEPEILADIVEELCDAGFAATGAKDGEEALHLIRETRPDLVVSDIQMPRLDGFALLRAVRAGDDLTNTVPFILLTAYGDNRHMIEGRQAGVDDYIVKPIDFELLIAAIEARLENCARRDAQSRNQATGASPQERKAARGKIAALSTRERQVLEKLSLGCANKVIAYELGLSIRTVELYRSSLMRALGVRSLADALKIAMAGGLIDLTATTRSTIRNR
ncbi:MAG: response regulator transcription factor [Rhizorhabdus sp.]|jgi:DNA-binding NarL/FixJ family response regulator|nr:MAG: response regulator transcription factor [Rhizorhabdus sp.]